jgi:hypothetical protein
MDIQNALKKLQAAGLTFADCVSCFGVSADENPYLKAAHEHHDREGEIEFDDTAIISESDDEGAYVMAWVWVTDEEAGVTRQESA